MKVTHVLIGVGVAVGVVLIAKKFLAPAAPTPAQQVGGGVTDLIQGAKDVFGGITSIFSGKPSSPTKNDNAAPIGGLNWDADGDQLGLTPTNVIEIRTLA